MRRGQDGTGWERADEKILSVSAHIFGPHSQQSEFKIPKEPVFYLFYFIYFFNKNSNLAPKIPSKPLTLDLMETLDLIFRRASYHWKTSYRKMKRLKVVEKLKIYCWPQGSRETDSCPRALVGNGTTAATTACIASHLIASLAGLQWRRGASPLNGWRTQPMRLACRIGLFATLCCWQLFA